MTLIDFPSEDIDVFVYYFADFSGTEQIDINEMILEQLTAFGLSSERRIVVVVDKEKLPKLLWRKLNSYLEIKTIPAILVSESTIGIENISSGQDLGQELERSSILAKIERDFITDNVPEQQDNVRAFLDEMLSAAQLEEINSTEDLIERLKISHEKADLAHKSDAEWNTIRNLGFCFEVAMYNVDKYIERNGLQNSVNEIKKRRWVVRLALTLYLLWYHMDQSLI